LFTEFKFLHDVHGIGGHILPSCEYEQKHNCPVCTTTTHHMIVPSTMTLNTLHNSCATGNSVSRHQVLPFLLRPGLEKAGGIGKGDKGEFGQTIEVVDIKWGGVS
jgi:hypothetical protein